MQTTPSMPPQTRRDERSPRTGDERQQMQRLRAAIIATCVVVVIVLAWNQGMGWLTARVSEDLDRTLRELPVAQESLPTVVGH